MNAPALELDDCGAAQLLAYKFASQEENASIVYVTPPDSLHGSASLSSPESESKEPQNPDSSNAYAKLEGNNFQFFVRKLEVTLGRRGLNEDNSEIDIDLGNVAKSVSRQHARLTYNFTTFNFDLLVLGRNGVVVDGNIFATGATVSLKDK